MTGNFNEFSMNFIFVEHSNKRVLALGLSSHSGLMLTLSWYPWLECICCFQFIVSK